MTPLEFIVEPVKLLLTWQPSEESGRVRTRRVVGEIIVDENEPGTWHFRYLFGTEDMSRAKDDGFLGHPAFKLAEGTYSQEVRETFLRRLPPRNREDFDDFLRMHGLPVPFVGSDVALLGYTQAKLPGDGFAFVPVFPENSEPCEYILEVAGLRHVYSGNLEEVHAEDRIDFLEEPNNPYDANAVAVLHHGVKLGYVNRALLPSFHAWMQHDLQAKVERKNGNARRPLVYVRVRVNCSSEVISHAHRFET